MNDNSTPISAKEYDSDKYKIIPYYDEFYNQAIDVVEQCGYATIHWLDLGCGTGTF